MHLLSASDLNQLRFYVSRMRVVCMVLTLFPNVWQAQIDSLYLDSLHKAWMNPGNSDSIRVIAYKNFLMNGVIFSDPDSGIALTKHLHQFAAERNFPFAASMGYRLEGISLYAKSDLPKALDRFTKALAIDEQIGNLNGIASDLNNMGNVYQDNENNERALENYQLALKTFVQLGNRVNEANCLVNIGYIYSLKNDFVSGIEYAKRALNIHRELNDEFAISNTLHTLGVLEYQSGNVLEGIEHVKESLEIRIRIDDKIGIANNHVALGKAHLLLNKAEEAIRYCTMAEHESMASELLSEWGKACDCLYQGYRLKGDYKKALEYHVKWKDLHDTIFGQEKFKLVTTLQMQHDFDKEQAVLQAEQEKKDLILEQEMRRQKIIRNGFIGGFSIVLLFAFVFLYQRNNINKARKRSDELLLNILPEEVAEELKEKGYAEARQFDQVTVLFTDFKGFTTISEKLSPSELVATIDECFKAFDVILSKYQIEKIKTIGDAYMAASGLPIPTTNHSEQVVSAALDIRDWMLEQKQRKGDSGFEIRIGVHSGPVVAGIVGLKKFQYDIWGDTVNTGSRMESSGAPGKVNISKETFEQIKHLKAFQFEYRGSIVAKNKGDMQMWFVERAGRREE